MTIPGVNDLGLASLVDEEEGGGEELEQEEEVEEEQTEETEEPGEEEGGDETEEDDETDEEEGEELEVAGDGAIVTMEDGSTLTVAELKDREAKAGLRQADYTKKTQQLAKDKREFLSTKTELEAWFGGMHDPDVMEAQCIEYWPEGFEQIVQRRAQELVDLESEDTTDREREIIKRERKLRLTTAGQKSAESRAQAIEAAEKKREEEEAGEAAQAEQRKQFRAWNEAAMSGAGLDTENRDHIDLVIGQLKMSVPQSMELTDAHFTAAAKKVAKLLGKAPKRRMTQVKRKAGGKLPPSTGNGKATAKRSNGRKTTGKPVGMQDFINGIFDR